MGCCSLEYLERSVERQPGTRQPAECGEALRKLAEGGAMIGWRHERAVGTYLHGVLSDDAWRCAFLNEVRRSRGFPERMIQRADPLEQRIQRWAAHVQHHLRPGAWARILDAVRP